MFIQPTCLSVTAQSLHILQISKIIVYKEGNAGLAELSTTEQEASSTAMHQCSYESVLQADSMFKLTSGIIFKYTVIQISLMHI